MCLVALGYDAKIEKLEGSSWAINSATLAIQSNLDDDMEEVSLSKVLTREEAAQMAFNTMKADLVRYANKGTNITLSDGSQVVIGATPATVYDDGEYGVSSDNNLGGDNAQFAEKYCKDLKLDSSNPDTYKRPGHTWTFDGDEINTYADAPVATFTKATDADDVAAALKGYVLVNDQNTSSDADDVTYKVNNTTKYNNSTAFTNATSGKIFHVTNYQGTETDSNVAANAANQTVAERLAASTKNGRLVEVYANSDKEITDIVCVGYAVTQVNKITTNKAGDVKYQFEGLSALNNYADADKTDDLEIVGEIAEDDFVTYCYDGETYTVYATTKVVGTQTAFNEDKETITVGGTKYDVATFTYDKVNGQQIDVDGTDNKFPNGDEDANYYIDQFGLAVYSDAIAADTKYAVVNAIAKVNGLSDKVQAELIFPDATRETVTVKSLKKEDGKAQTLGDLDTSGASNAALAGIVYTYTVNKDNEYELTAVPSAEGKSVNKETIANGNVTTKGNPVVNLATGITTNDKTIFVVKSMDGKDTVYKPYTGFKAVPTIDAVTEGSKSVYVDYAKNSSGAVEFVYIDATKTDKIVSESDKGDIVYITSTKKTTENVSGEYVYYYDAIINGVKGTLATDEASLKVGLYKVTTVDGDVATVLVEQSTGNFANNDDYKKFTTLSDSADAKDGVVVINNTTYTYEGKETVYVIDADGEVSEGSVSALDIATNAADYKEIYVKEVDNSSAANEIDTVYVILK